MAAEVRATQLKLDEDIKQKADKKALFERISRNDETVYDLKLNDLQFTEAEFKALALALRAHPACRIVRIFIDFSKIEPDQISIYAEFIFQVMSIPASFYSGWHLFIEDETITEKSVQNLSTLLKIRPPRFLREVILSRFVPNPSQFDVVFIPLLQAIFSNDKIRKLEFSSGKLYLFGAKNLLRMANEMTQSKHHIRYVWLKGNGLSKLGDDFIIQFVTILKSRLLQIHLETNGIGGMRRQTLYALLDILEKNSLGHYDQNILWNSAEYAGDGKELSEADQLEYINIDMRRNWCDGFNMGRLPFQMPLSPDQFFDFFYKFMSEPKRRHRYSLIDYYVKEKKKELSYQQRLALAKLRFEFPDYSDHAKDYELRQEDRLAWFLKFRLENNEDFNFNRLLEIHQLYNTELPASRLFVLWRLLTPAIQEDYIEFQDTFFNQVLGKLRLCCREFWPRDDFYEACFDRLNEWKDKIDSTFDAIKVMEMGGWLIWTLSSLLQAPSLSLRGTNRIFKEIMEYPDPKMRYFVANSLIELLVQEQVAIRFSLHGQIIKKQENHLIVPAILLCQIIRDKGPSEEEQKEEEETLILTAEAILKAIPGGYANGQFLKSFVSALNVVSNNTKLSKKEKIQIIAAAFTLKNPKTEERHRQVRVLMGQYARRYIQGNGNVQYTSSEEKATWDALLSALNLHDYLKFPKKITRWTKADSMRVAENKLKRTLQQRALMMLKDIEQPLQKQQSYWLLVQGLGLLGDLKALLGISQDTLMEFSKKVFIKYFQVPEERYKYYDFIFGNKSDASALFVYLAKISALLGDERESMVKLFSEYVRLCLSENASEFYRARYDEDRSPHLAVIFKGRPELKRKWMVGYRQPFDDFVKIHQIAKKPFSINYPKFLWEKIFGFRHLKSEEYPQLKAYLEAYQTKDEAKKHEIYRGLSVLAYQKPEVQANRVMAAAAAATAPSLDDKMIVKVNIQLAMIDLINSDNDKNRIVQIKKISRGLRQVEAHGEFLSDLNMLLHRLRNNQIKQKEVDTSRWTITMTDHYWLAFMSGTHVMGSCQRVDGDVENNKCLLAYPMDGKNQFLDILNENNGIVARAVLRLLRDTVLGTPILYLEKIYPDFLPPLWEESLGRFAEVIADHLGLELLSSESTETSSIYPNPVESLGSVAPNEFVDAIFESTNGTFTIPKGKAQLIYSPRQKPGLHFQWSGAASATVAAVSGASAEPGRLAGFGFS